MSGGSLCSAKRVSWIQTGSGLSDVFTVGFLKGFAPYTCSAPYTLSPSIWGCKNRKNIDLSHCCSSWQLQNFGHFLCMPAGHEHWSTDRVSLARATISILVAPALGSPVCRANPAESMQSMPSYPISSGTERRTSRAECRRSNSMRYISDNCKMLILAPSSLCETCLTVCR